MSDRTPVHIRRNVESFQDPYIEEESLADFTHCKRCGGVYAAGRWYLKDQLPYGRPTPVENRETICPACRKQRDRVPGGVIKLTGTFIAEHKEEILNLIRNQTDRAQTGNPLERIMDMESAGSGLTITTTSEKLAQKIGRALHRAYSGSIEYQFGDDTKVARVNWHREQ